MRRLLSGSVVLWVLLAVLLLRVFDPAPVEQIRNLVFDSYQWIEERSYDPRLPVRIVDADDESLARLEALYRLYDERLAAYAKTPPPADWDGVYVATTK